MTFENVKQQKIWCIHFWGMTLEEGLLMGKEGNDFYVRLDGAAINDIEIICAGNVFFDKDAGERALFKANLAGKKRPANKDIRDIE
jgi:hypothetical protein